MPIYMIMPRYSHNYALFYQLLDSNLFTHRNIMLSWEKPLVKPMAPGSIFYHISFQSTFICICIIKYQKYIYLIILSLSDLIFASGREGIENPFIALVASSLFVCVGAWDLWGASYWCLCSNDTSFIIIRGSITSRTTFPDAPRWWLLTFDVEMYRRTKRQNRIRYSPW